MRINFELLDLRAFLAVLDLGGFHKAAAALNLSQPALSRRIQSLEAAVGAPLIERTTRHVAATLIGRSIEPLARRLIDELEELVGALTGAGQQKDGAGNDCLRSDRGVLFSAAGHRKLQPAISALSFPDSRPLGP